LSFLAIVLAYLVGGWGAGLLALVLGQILTWYLLFPPLGTFGLKESAASTPSFSQPFLKALFCLSKRSTSARPRRSGSGGSIFWDMRCAKSTIAPTTTSRPS
jgi:hypothetical protein